MWFRLGETNIPAKTTQLPGVPPAFIQGLSRTWLSKGMVHSLVNTKRGLLLATRRRQGCHTPSGQAEGCCGHGAGQDTGKGQVPGPQLILTAPDKVSKLLVVGVVVVLDSEEHGGRDLH